METHAVGPPDSEDARKALASAEAEEDASLNRPVPVFYFPILAAMLFAIFALNAIDASSGVMRGLTIIGILVLAIGMGAVAGTVSANQPGYRGIRIKWSRVIPAMLLAQIFPVAAIILEPTLGSWVWLAIGAVFALLLLTFGVAYQRKHRHG